MELTAKELKQMTTIHEQYLTVCLCLKSEAHGAHGPLSSKYLNKMTTNQGQYLTVCLCLKSEAHGANSQRTKTNDYNL